MSRPGIHRSIPLVLAFGAAAIGCASTRPLMPTPALYRDQGEEALFRNTPAARRTPDVELLYITDRAPETEPGSPLSYGQERAHSVAYGSAVVELGPNHDWSTVVQQSQLAERTQDLNLELGAVQELGRFPEEPYAVESTASGPARSATVVRQHAETRAAFQADLQRRLEEAPSREVILYVHGFNETFARASFTTAELCHFLGREHVCAYFTWPASSSGNILTSFTTTTESARFAESHLVKTIRWIARTPGVEGIHLLAHSRGSALLLDALRDLVKEAFVYGVAPASHLKLVNVILVAPDIDEDVAIQKFEVFVSDPDVLAHWPSQLDPPTLSGRFTVYSSPQDRALRVSRMLFRSRARTGQLSADEAPLEEQQRLEKWEKFDLILYQGLRTDLFGHAYFVTNPRVSSDLIELLRYGTKPGEPGRSLEQIGPVLWTFPEETR